MIVLGLDISSTSTGWAVLKHGRFYNRESIDYGIISPPSNYGPAHKLSYFKEQLTSILTEMPVGILIGMEDSFFFKNPKTLKVLSRFAGVALSTCWEICEIEPTVVAVSEIRRSWGAQDKKSVFKLVTDKFKLGWDYNKYNDVADALAVAYHLSKSL